jgi:hypothetical protein
MRLTKLSLFLCTVVLGSLAAITPRAEADPYIQVTVFNYFKFFRVIGPNNLACYLDSPTAQRLYGEIEEVTLADGTREERFMIAPWSTFSGKLKKYDKQIATIKKQIKKARKADKPALVTSLKAKLKLKSTLRKEFQAIVAGCKTYLRNNSEQQLPLFAVPTPTPLPPAGECLGEISEGRSNGFSAGENPARLTQVEPGSNTLRFHVDNVLGDDASPSRGQSESAPLRTIARALALAVEASVSGRAPHVILLRKGREFNENIGTLPLSGLKDTEPFVLTSYGDGDDPRPVVSSTITIPSERSHIMIANLELRSSGRDPSAPNFNPLAPDQTAITIAGSARNILIENMLIRFFTRGVAVRGTNRSVSGQARDIYLHRNNIVDSWSAQGPAFGVTFEDTSEATLIRNYIGGIGNVSGVGTQSHPQSTAVKADYIECSFIARENVVYGSRYGIQLWGQYFDEFNQLQPYTNEVNLLSNLFYRTTVAVVLDTPTVFATQNITAKAERHGDAQSVGGWDIRNASSILAYLNVFANNQGPTNFWNDFGLKISGLMNLAFYDVHNNDFHRVANSLVIGPSKWYESILMRTILGQIEEVALNFDPADLLFRDNRYSHDDPNATLVTHIRGQTGQEAEYQHRREWYDTPNVSNAHFAHREIGTVASRTNYFAPPAWFCCDPGQITGCIPCTPICIGTLIRMSPNNFKNQNNYYDGDLFTQGDPSTGSPMYSIADFDRPNEHNIAQCLGSAEVVVGQPASVYGIHDPARWQTYANVLAPGEPNGMKLEPFTRAAPDRDILAFAQATNLRIVGPSGALEPVDSEADFFAYVIRSDIHQVAQNMQYDTRLLFLFNWLRAGFIVP